MESRKNIAIEMHNKGYNCAQSVALTYADLVDIEPEQLFRITEGFGLGGGNMQGTCGAISGALALVGLLNSCGDLENPTTKAKTYGLNKEILENFGEYLPKFKKVLPHDYDKMLRLIAQMEEKGEDSEQAQIEAFYAMKNGK